MLTLYALRMSIYLFLLVENCELVFYEHLGINPCMKLGLVANDTICVILFASRPNHPMNGGRVINKSNNLEISLLSIHRIFIAHLSLSTASGHQPLTLFHLW